MNRNGISEAIGVKIERKMLRRRLPSITVPNEKTICSACSGCAQPSPSAKIDERPLRKLQ
jgi:hypothetical protein